MSRATARALLLAPRIDVKSTRDEFGCKHPPRTIRVDGVLKLILSRAVQGVVVLFVVSALTFALLAAAGGDALGELASEQGASEATLQEMRRVYGLDEPLASRYFNWLTNLARGRMGESFYYHAPVATIIRPRLLRTLALAAVALALAISFSLALGALAARRRGSLWDRASELVILLTASTPRIVLALVALAIVARTSWFPVGGAGAETLTADFSLLRILPPAVVLALPLVALFLAQAREGLSHALAQDFVQVARAKGLPERTVIMRHALRDALNPLITLTGYAAGSVVSGSVIVETVLGWSGLGALSVNAVRHRDVPLLMGVVMVTATAVLVGNLVADILLRLNDPRLRQDHAQKTRRGTNRSLNLPAPGA
ncbi:MAG: peptide/nickel transport system permease protein [Pyrinomonadaceae bacterium]|nr:peptide/nickel transport system permease protein [Pyrinomonadaceae bacterium]